MKTEQFLDELVNGGIYTSFAKSAHETWKAQKEGQGWTLGPRDDAAKKNPLMMPFESLSADIQGQNSLTPYAVANYLRVNHSTDSVPALRKTLTGLASGSNADLLDRVGEYVHSHFVAAQLSKGATLQSRNDMVSYDRLTADQKSWDLGTVKKVAAFYHTRLNDLV